MTTTETEITAAPPAVKDCTERQIENADCLARRCHTTVYVALLSALQLEPVGSAFHTEMSKAVKALDVGRTLALDFRFRHSAVSQYFLDAPSES